MRKVRSIIHCAKLAAVLTILAMAFMLSQAGCAGTSAIFKASAALPGQHIAADAKTYVTNDATLTPAARNSALDVVGAFAASVATTSAIDVDAVETAWNAMEAPYRAYIGSDTKLDPNGKAWLTSRADKFDTLVQREQRRRVGASVPLIGPLLPGGNPPAPTTSPSF